MASLYTDGGTLGLNGEIIVGGLIENQGTEVFKYSQKLGIKGTNNKAEYAALLTGLKACASLGIKEVTAYSDSQLMVHQFNGIYKIKDIELKAWNYRIQLLCKEFDSVTFVWVPRTTPQIKVVDAMVNSKKHEM